MELNGEGILELEGCLEDDDYELFHSGCNMLQIEEESEEKDMFPLEYGEYKEGVARVDESPTHQFDKDKPIQYEDPKLKETNLGDEASSNNILVNDNWSPMLKAIAFKFFMEYKDVFA